MNSVTLYGQAGGAWAIGSPASGEDIPTDIWFVRAVARWFATPNDKFQAEVGYARATKTANETSTPSSAGNVLNWGGSYEHRLSIPISLFAAYDGYSYKSGHNCPTKATNNVFTVGARFIFNQNTLLSNDRKGATLDMPKFNRVFPWADTVNDNFSCQPPV